MNALVALAMARELSKSAAVPAIMQRLWHSGAARAVGGAAIGGGAGYAMGGGGPDSSPEQQSASRRAGAIRGALLGAAGGYASPLLTSGGRQRAKEGIKRFYERERHGLLGGEAPASMTHGLEGEALLREQAAQKAGLTSIPGLVKGVFTKQGSTMREAWRQSDTLGKVMAGADVAMGAKDVFDPTVPGGKAEKAGRLIGSSGGYLLGSRLPFLGGMLFASGTGAAGKYLGRAVDKITGSGQGPIETPPEYATQATP